MRFKSPPSRVDVNGLARNRFSAKGRICIHILRRGQLRRVGTGVGNQWPPGLLLLALGVLWWWGVEVFVSVVGGSEDGLRVDWVEEAHHTPRSLLIFRP